MRAAPHRPCMSRPLLVVTVLLALLLAGCTASEAPDAPEGAGPDGLGGAGVWPPPVEARGDAAFLGLAYYADAPREAVASRVADRFEPVACFGGAGLDVILVVSREAYLGNEAPPPVATVALLTCARSPFERTDGNEPHWYVLEGWTTPEHAAWLTARGQAPIAADVSIEGDAAGFRFEARTPQGLLVRGEFVTPDVPTPNPFLPDCSPREMIGRALSVTNGTVSALDWTKTEATCSAVATAEWPEGSALEAVLGPSRPPAGAWGVEVDEASYAWHRLA